MEKLFEVSLLQGLTTKLLDDSILPIPASVLYSNYILSCRPAGLTLDIRKTSWKKVHLNYLR